jgi:hypothetical protein
MYGLSNFIGRSAFRAAYQVAAPAPSGPTTGSARSIVVFFWPAGKDSLNVAATITASYDLT